MKLIKAATVQVLALVLMTLKPTILPVTAQEPGQMDRTK
jgi:hypothetical protein